MKSLPIVVGVLVAASALATPIRAQTPAAKLVDSARVEIEAATAVRDTPRLSRAVVRLDRALVVFPDDPYLLHYRGYAAYRQAVLHFTANRMDAAAPFVPRAMADLERSGEKLAWPETFALLAAASGFAIALDPSRGMELGQQIGILQGRAAQLGPKNPRVFMIQGIGAHNTPPEYGGGADRARELLNKAIALFATDAPPPLAPAWGRDEAIAYLKIVDGGPAKRP